jgi:hypothetical protein
MACDSTSRDQFRVEPLTKCRANGTLYTRRPQVEHEIREALQIAPNDLITLAQNKQISPETICYFYQHLTDIRVQTQLIETLILRHILPNLAIEAALQHEAEEIQAEVLTRITRDLNSPDGAGDYAQIMFHSYVKARKLDVIRRLKKDIVLEPFSDDPNFPNENDNTYVDPFHQLYQKERLKLLMNTLSEEERDLCLKRYFLGIPIGSDDWRADKGKVTLARHYQVSGRTIRSWLAKIQQKIIDPCKCK